MVSILQRRPVELGVDIPDVTTAVATIRQNVQAPMLARRLRVRAYDDGRVIARFPGSRSSSPPRLYGQFVPSQQGVLLKGSIVESSNDVTIPAVFAVLAVIMAPLAIAFLVGGEFTNPGLYVCGVAALLFAALAYGLFRLRGVGFRYEADRLEQAMHVLLPASRHPR